jgi:hypothetical protein
MEYDFCIFQETDVVIPFDIFEFEEKDQHQHLELERNKKEASLITNTRCSFSLSTLNKMMVNQCLL